jgi:hypothetical protein
MQEESSLPGWIVVYAMLAKLCDCAGLHPAPYAHNLRWLMLRLHAGHHCRPLLHRLWPRRMCKQVQCMRWCQHDQAPSCHSEARVGGGTRLNVTCLAYPVHTHKQQQALQLTQIFNVQLLRLVPTVQWATSQIAAWSHLL